MNEKDSAHHYPSNEHIKLPEQHDEPYHTKRSVALCIFLSISPGILIVYPSAIWMFAIFGSTFNCSVFAFGGVLGTLAGISLKELNFKCSLVCFHGFISLCWLLTYLVTYLHSLTLVKVLFFFEGTAVGLMLIILYSHAMKFPRAQRDTAAGFIEIGIMLGVLLISLILGLLEVQLGLVVCFIFSLLSTVVAIFCIPTSVVSTMHNSTCDLSSVESKDPLCDTSKTTNRTLLDQKHRIQTDDPKLLLLRVVEACLQSFMGLFLLHFMEFLCMNFAASVIESYIVFSASAVIFAVIYQMYSSDDELGRELPGLMFTGALLLILIRSQFDMVTFVPFTPFGVIMILLGLTVAVSLGQLYWLCLPPTTELSHGHDKVLLAWWLSGSIYLKLVYYCFEETNLLTLVFILTCIGFLVSLISYFISHVTSTYRQLAQ